MEQDALAVGGEFGILEGRSAALIHPLVMSGLFVFTLYAGYLGWQWRRVRTIQNEINELKKQVKPVPVTPDGTPPAEPSKPSPVELKIQQLTEVNLPETSMSFLPLLHLYILGKKNGWAVQFLETISSSNLLVVHIY